MGTYEKTKIGDEEADLEARAEKNKNENMAQQILKQKWVENKKPLFIPYIQQTVEQQEQLFKRLGVVDLPQGEVTLEDVVRTLREMSEIFKKNTWKPRQIGPRKFVIELHNDNALDYLISRSYWPCKENRSFESPNGMGKKIYWSTNFRGCSG